MGFTVCRSLRGLIAIAMLLLAEDVSHAQSSYCVEHYKLGDVALGIAPSDANQLITDVANSIGVKLSVAVIPCRYVEKAEALEYDGSTAGRPAGQYVIYNPDWVREVIGNDRVQAIALFGHEFGHLLNQHYSSRSNIPRIQKETEADEFAGCAVARLGGSWDTLSSLLSRLRRENKDRDYPDRLTSLDAARRGFGNCGGALIAPHEQLDPLECESLPDGTVNVRLVPQLGNFSRAELDHLSALLSCDKYKYSMGTAGIFPGRPMNVVAYSGVLDFRIIAKLLVGLSKGHAQPNFICNDVDQLRDDYVLLAHHEQQPEESPLTGDDINRLVNAKSGTEFDNILRQHHCFGGWSLTGPATKQTR